MGLPWWLSGKESTCNAREARDAGSFPRLERSPGEGNSNPLQYSCLENPRDRGAWWATVRGVAKSLDTTKHRIQHSRGTLMKCYLLMFGSENMATHC